MFKFLAGKKNSRRDLQTIVQKENGKFSKGIIYQGESPNLKDLFIGELERRKLEKDLLILHYFKYAKQYGLGMEQLVGLPEEFTKLRELLESYYAEAILSVKDPEYLKGRGDSLRNASACKQEILWLEKNPHIELVLRELELIEPTE